MESAEAGTTKVKPKGAPGPILGTIWWTLTLIIAASVAGAGVDSSAYHIPLGCRSIVALAGYIAMQIGLWIAENKWDEGGSKAYLEEAKKDHENVSGGKNSDDLL